MANPMEPRIAHLVQGFEGLRPDGLAELARMYAPQASFKDPFQEVQGLAAITEVYRHMYVALDEPRFKIHTTVTQGQDCVMTWDFLFRFKGQAAQQVIRGATHLTLDAQGLITQHRDYWDAAEELYEKLPVLGGFMRWLKRRARS